MSSRRRFLGLAGAASAVTAVPAWVGAQVVRTPLNNMPDKIRALTQGTEIHPGRVKLDVPPLVENGHLVAISVSVESPMTATDHVKAIHVLTERNPLPEMITVRLGPRAGRAFAATRVRMADTQNVIAIAEMSDGTFWSDSAHLIVTLAACLEELPSGPLI
jgi:sulfur-oxidizing protein SoxY